MYKNLFIFSKLLMIITFLGCAGDSCGDCAPPAITKSEILSYGSCGDFSDRNDTLANLSTNNTYIIYEIDKYANNLIIKQYNVAMACDISELNVSASWKDSAIQISTNSMAQSCYCLRDIQMKFYISGTYEDSRQIKIKINDLRKATNDPDIAFIVKEGGVDGYPTSNTETFSFTRSVEPWGL